MVSLGIISVLAAKITAEIYSLSFYPKTNMWLRLFVCLTMHRLIFAACVSDRNPCSGFTKEMSPGYGNEILAKGSSVLYRAPCNQQ